MDNEKGIKADKVNEKTPESHKVYDQRTFGFNSLFTGTELTNYKEADRRHVAPAGGEDVESCHSDNKYQNNHAR